MLLAAVAWGALAFGAVYPWAYTPLAAVCAGLGVWAVRHVGTWHDREMRVLGLAMSVVALAMAVQLLPVPFSLLRSLSPGAEGVLTASQLAFVPPAHHPLTLGSWSTLAALVLFVSFALVVLGWSGALQRRWRIERLLVGLATLALVLTVLGIVQNAILAPMDPTERLVYGFWRPQHGGAIFGPFINRNHYAGWMVMAAPLILGYAAGLIAEAAAGDRVSDGVRRLFLGDAKPISLAVMSVAGAGLAVLLTASRSGIAAFAVAVAALVVLGMREVAGRAARIKLIVGAGVLLVGLLAWAGNSEPIQRFVHSSQDLSERMSAWQETGRIIHDFPVVGTGLGNFGRAMVVYQRARRNFLYLQSHNDYLQLAAEGGVLVGLPALLVLGVVIRTVWRRLRTSEVPFTRWVRLGAIAGLVGIAAQSLVEFSLQMPGNTLLCAVLLGIALHRGTAPEGGTAGKEGLRAHRV